MFKVDERNNVVVIDPNATYGDSTYMQPPEDYCISLDLMVEVPGRVNTLDNKKTYSLQWRSTKDGGQGGNARFLQGKRVGNANYLTDSYTDITFNNSTSGELIESVGISSVNIDYDSWYMPQITITFVDVRGAGLFNPSEFANTNESASGSFFKAFFTFPYPLWKLQIKGFYGEPVTYTLHCVDVRYEFNSSVADFTMVAKFVGYTYAFLADIQFNLLKAAPYITYSSSEPGRRWNEMRDNGTFTFDNNMPMRTINQYVGIFDSITQLIEKMAGEDPVMKQFENAYKQHSSMEDITESWRSLVSSLERPENNGFKNDDVIKTISFYRDSSVDSTAIFIDGLKEKKDSLIDKINKFNEHTSGIKIPLPGTLNNDITFSKSIYLDDVSNKTGNEFTSQSSLDKIQSISINKYAFTQIGGSDDRITGLDVTTSFTNNGQNIVSVSKDLEQFGAKGNTIVYIDKNDGNGLNEYRVSNQFIADDTKNTVIFYDSQTARTEYVDVNFMMYLGDDYNALNKFYKNASQPLYLAPDNFKNKQKYKYTLTYKNFIDTLISLDSSLVEDSANIEEYVKTSMNSKVVEGLGFDPTVGNIMSLIFAHLDTFMFEFYNCLNNCKNRKISDTNIDVNRTDLKESVDISETLPPFPLYTQIKDGEEIWIGKKNGGVKMNNGDDLEEVKFIYAVKDAIKKVIDESKELKVDNGSKKYVTWLPINPYDNPIINENQQENPYANFGGDYENIVTQIGIRMFAAASRFPLPNKSPIGIGGSGRPVVDEKLFIELAKAEAKNIISGIGSSSDLLEKLSVKDGGRSIKSLLKGERYNQKSLPNGNSAVYKEVTTTDTTYAGVAMYGMGASVSSSSAKYSFLTKKDGDTQYQILPLYSNSISGYSSDWFGNGAKDTFLVNRKTPAFINNFSSSSADYMSFSSGAFKILNDLNTNELNNYKSQIDNKVLVENWNLDTVPSGGVDSAKSAIDFIAPNTYSENCDSLVNLKDYTNYRSSNRGQFISLSADSTSSEIVSKNPINYKEYYTNFGDTKVSAILTDVKSTKTTPDEVHYPEIKTWYSASTYNGVSHLFGSKIFYTQNDEVVGSDFKGRRKKEYRNRAKAILFLQSLSYDEEKINDLFSPSNGGGIQRIPRVAALMIGSLIYRVNQLKTTKMDPIMNSFYFDPTKYSKMGGDKRGNVAKDIDDIFPNIFSSEFFSKDLSGIKINLPPQITNTLEAYFIDFADNEFDCILDDFELKTKSGDIINSTTFTTILSSLNKTQISESDIYNIFGAQLFKVYDRFYVDQTKEGFSLLNRPSTNGVNSIIKLYSEDVSFVFNSPVVGNNGNFGIELSPGLVNSYITTLVDELSGTSSKVDSSAAEFKAYDEDLICLEMYKTFKNLYDKWCASRKYDDYKLNNFYKRQFKFIDKFYVDISDKLIFNIDKVNKIFSLGNDVENPTSTMNLYSAISNLMSDHQMLFIPTPNSIDWGVDIDATGYERSVNVAEKLQKVFTPITWTDCAATYDTTIGSSQFTGIYVGKPSSILDIGRDYEYKNDGFLFTDPTFKGTENTTMKIPCFAVSVGAQNNAIFKNIACSMNNPVNTDQSLAAIYNLSNSKPKAQGQDLYSIYSTNSYQVEIEMMGCAQIQPLMYFQLMNAPMFRGSYMIFKINHNIEPGNMTTKITAMRMSKMPITLCDTPFVYDGYFDNYRFTPLTIGDNTVKNDRKSYVITNKGVGVNLSNFENLPYNVNLTLKRVVQNGAYTSGKLYVNNVYLCDTLEDAVRNLSSTCSKENTSDGHNCHSPVYVSGTKQGKPNGNPNVCGKIDKITAIPAGSYKVSIVYSKSKGRKYPFLFDVPHFSGILMHDGADINWTDGCILVGESDGAGNLSNSMYYTNILTKILADKNVTIDVINMQ